MASNILTYESLRSFVIGAINRTDPRVDEHLELMIAMAQRIICSSYQLQDFLVWSEGTLLVDNNMIPKDVGWFKNYSFGVRYNEPDKNNFSQFKYLTYRTESYLRSAYNDSSLIGLPESYSDFDQKNSIIVAPTPDVAYPFIWGWYQTPPLLSPQVSTNIVTERSPHILCGFTLTIANLFLQNYQEGQTWEKWSETNFQKIKSQDGRLAFDMAQKQDHTT